MPIRVTVLCPPHASHGGIFPAGSKNLGKNISMRESSNSNTQLSPHANFTGTTSYVVPKSETILKCDDSIEHIMHEQRLGEMDELEAELAVEFERLQFSLDTEQTQHQCSKDVMDTASSVSQSLSYGELTVRDDCVLDEEILLILRSS
ncbi:uncharacterized protein LOC133804119 [Humulus lupulus]|uniref:uncharacterized protein LOC133804119 n=1 Tax=Humulus lupulus TaxID=3486 RepID=UPI002B406C27|nr:uncharacterized protein LOC133804119 [Humulus lupulus]XP_062098259.1 uncharacterized protein LOC133804119 [Humulus lupulus]